MMTKLFITAFILHNIADWFLQNEWMAINKTNPRHPAGYVHAGIHAVLLMLVFPVWLALIVGVIHWLIDLRFILAWWKRVYRQTTEGVFAMPVAVWQDQVAHWIVLFVAALIAA